MVRPEKVAVVNTVRDRIQSSSATMLTEYRGLTVTELAQLRAQLRTVGAEYKVAKNTLIAIAARDAGLDMPAGLLTGPTAVTFCGDDPVAAAKVLKAFARDNPELVVKGGILDGRLLDAGEAMQLAELASREELLSRLAGMFTAIVAQPARLALANLTKAARLFAALQEKRAAAGETPPPEPAPVPTEGETEQLEAEQAGAGADQRGEAAPQQQPLSGEAADSDAAPSTETSPAE